MYPTPPVQHLPAELPTAYREHLPNKVTVSPILPHLYPQNTNKPAQDTHREKGAPAHAARLPRLGPCTEGLEVLVLHLFSRTLHPPHDSRVYESPSLAYLDDSEASGVGIEELGL